MRYLTAHFTLEEMIESEYATRHGMDNMPSEVIIEQLRLLCVEILEPERLELDNAPIVILSGYRSPIVNCGIGGARKSQHMKGQAGDHHVIGWTDEDAVRRIAASRIPFDQLILEFPPNGWIHISRAEENPRRQILVARRATDGTVDYLPWRSWAA